MAMAAEVLDNVENETPCGAAAPLALVAVKAPPAPYPDLSDLTVTKVPHKNLILEGVCTNCGHCGQPLSDSVSIQRGIGPVCSKKGYSEDAVDGDEMQAMIDLAEFPELVEFLTQHYAPLGIRGLVNGLVRVASLNRPRGRGRAEGNEAVFAACADAIESLGHKKMADLLRNTLVTVWIREMEGHPGVFSVKTLKSRTPIWWKSETRRSLRSAYWDRDIGATVVRFHHPKDPKSLFNSSLEVGGEPVKNKRVVWNLVVRAFPGLAASTPSGVVKIRAERGPDDEG